MAKKSLIKNALFQTHWFLGITLGLVLMVIGVTGAMLSYEHEILHALNRDLVPRVAAETPRLSPPELLDRARALYPDRVFTGVAVSSEDDEAARLFLAPKPGERGRGENWMVSPFDATRLGQPVGQDFFRAVTGLHRWLLIDGQPGRDIARQVVAMATIACVFFTLSGIYLRWPRRALDWRAWLALDLRRKGRALLHHLHLIIGTWVAIPFLIMCVTGLTWSHPSFRNLLTDLSGAERVVGPPGMAPGAASGGRPGGGRAPEIDLNAAWDALKPVVGDFAMVSIRFPTQAGQGLDVRWRDRDAPHERATNAVKLDPVTLAIGDLKRYDALPLGQRLTASFFPLHSGAYFGPVGVVVFMLASLAMPLFTITGWILYLARRRRRRERRTAGRAALSPSA